MSQWGAQCVIATHAIAFIDIPGDRCVYELSRTGYAATIAPLDPGTVTPYTPIARAIGLDRGELLSRSRAFVSWSAPPPLCWRSSSPRGLIARASAWYRSSSDSRTSHPRSPFLLRLTAAPLAALSVSTTPGEIARLRMARAHERTEAAQQSGELGAVAAILDLATRKRRQIEILTLGVADLQALLSDDATRDAIAERMEDAVWRIEQLIITAEAAEQTGGPQGEAQTGGA